MEKFLILVVLYKRSVSSSETLQSLLKSSTSFKVSTLIIWDNSPVTFVTANDLFEFEHIFSKVKLIHEGNNRPLSEIYNLIISDCIHTHEYLVLLDHDTSLTDSYWRRAEVAISDNSDISLFVPVIFGNGKMVSPAKLYYFIGRYFNYEIKGRIKSKFLTAVNSGMLIRTKYFIDYHFRYDEYLRFYGTDDYFMKMYSRNFKNVYVMDCKIEHSLSMFDKSESIEIKAFRFNEIIRAMKYLNRRSIFISFMLFLYSFLKSLSLAVKYRSTKFIRG